MTDCSTRWVNNKRYSAVQLLFVLLTDGQILYSRIERRRPGICFKIRRASVPFVNVVIDWHFTYCFYVMSANVSSGGESVHVVDWLTDRLVNWLDGVFSRPRSVRPCKREACRSVSLVLFIYRVERKHARPYVCCFEVSDTLKRRAI